MAACVEAASIGGKKRHSRLHTAEGRTYLKHGGKFEVAEQMAAHESARTTELYDRRGDDTSLDGVERIVI